MNKLKMAEKQKIELITSIESSGEIPFKLAYLGDGAQLWDLLSKLRANNKKGIHHMEQELLQKRLSAFLDSFKTKKINIVDLGCGNGTPILPILKKISEDNKLKIRYVAMDISQELINLAEKEVKKRHPTIEIIKKIVDFEAGNFADFIYDLNKNEYSSFFIFFGNTLGNFSNPGRILSNFRDSMGINDYLLIGTELENLSKVNLIVERYKNEEPVKKFVTNIPKNIGLNDLNSNYLVSWNERKQQVEIKLNLTKNVDLKIENEKILLEKYEQILLVRSAKYNEQTITKLLSESGFRNELMTTDKNRSYILTLVQPSRYQ
jgi:uncharacterized SAM-dependent methyltransferase